MLQTIMKAAIRSALLAALSVANAQDDGAARARSAVALGEAGRAQAQGAPGTREFKRTRAAPADGFGEAAAELDRPRYGCAPGRTPPFRISRTACPIAPARRD